jgi:CRP-like cAMP-binding protein
VGERASLRNGTRTATLWARTAARVAAVPPDALDPEALSSLDATHRREE